MCSHAQQLPQPRPLSLVWYWLSQINILDLDPGVVRTLLEAATSQALRRS